MNKKSLTKALAINVVVLVLVAALLGGLTFAWFTTRQTADTQQVIQVGNFDINLNDTTQEYQKSQNIAFTKAFPSTETVANADDKVATDKAKKENVDYINGNKFAFSVKNSGEIDALFGLKVAVNGSNNANLTDLMRFNVYVKDNTGTVTYNEVKYTKKSTTAITSVTDLETALIAAVGKASLPESSTVATAKEVDMAELPFATADGKNEVELLVVAWIDKTGEYGNGEKAVNNGDYFEFAVQMAAIQSVGGITATDVKDAKIWDNMPLQEWTQYAQYNASINTSESFDAISFGVKYDKVNILNVATDSVKAGKYANKVEINLTNASTSAAKVTWAISAVNGLNTTDTSKIHAQIFVGDVKSGDELTNITAIETALKALDIANGTNKITIVFWTEETTDVNLALNISVSNVVAP